MRFLSKKAGYTSTMDVTDMLVKVGEMEGTIYRILSLSNKTRLSEVLGYSRQGFHNKIRDRSFTLKELIMMFRIIKDFKDEDYKRCKVERIKRHRVMDLMAFNKLNRKR